MFSGWNKFLRRFHCLSYVYGNINLLKNPQSTNHYLPLFHSIHRTIKFSKFHKLSYTHRTHIIHTNEKKRASTETNSLYCI